MSFKALAASLAVGTLGLTLSFGAHCAEPQVTEQFFPVLVFRSGPYASNGVPWANGIVDYLELVNARDGVWWAGAEQDVAGSEQAAAGYNALTLQHSAEQIRVHQDVLKYVHGAGQGTGRKDDVGQGLLNAMLAVEPVRAAQRKFSNIALTGEQVRWGLEHLDIDHARIKALGMEGMLQLLKTSCLDHEGAHRYRMHTWSGTRWAYSSDWYESNRQLLKPLMDAAAKKYADEKSLPVRDCAL